MIDRGDRAPCGLISWRTLLLRIGDKCPEYGGLSEAKEHIVSILPLFLCTFLLSIAWPFPSVSALQAFSVWWFWESALAAYSRLFILRSGLVSHFLVDPGKPVTLVLWHLICSPSGCQKRAFSFLLFCPFVKIHLVFKVNGVAYSTSGWIGTCLGHQKYGCRTDSHEMEVVQKAKPIKPERVNRGRVQ